MPGRLEFYTRDDSTFVHHMQINHHGGIAMGANNAGYDGQILSIKAGTGNNVLYGESSDANCIVSLRDDSSTVNVGYGATGNAHIFSQDGSEIARISTGSADKYPTSGGLGGIGGSGTNLHLLADDSEIRMANNIIHSDNSGLTKFTIRAAYGALSSGAELSLDGGYISFNTGTNFVETMRAHTGVLSIGNSTTISSSATSYLLQMSVSRILLVSLRSPPLQKHIFASGCCIAKFIIELLLLSSKSCDCTITLLTHFISSRIALRWVSSMNGLPFFLVNHSSLFSSTTTLSANLLAS